MSDYTNNYLKVNLKDFVRGELNIPASDKLKKNGTFERGLYYKINSYLEYKRVNIQTMLWTTSSGRSFYISIFPSFIIKYNKVATNLIEFISTNVRKGESIFNYIEDADSLIECEDILSRSCERVNSACYLKKFDALLNSKYTTIFNTPVKIPKEETNKFNTYSFMQIVILLSVANICSKTGILKGSCLSSLNEVFKFLR